MINWLLQFNFEQYNKWDWSHSLSQLSSRYFPEFLSHFVNLLLLISFLASSIGIYWVCWSKRYGDNKAKIVKFLTIAVSRILQMLLLLWSAVHISDMNDLAVNESWDNYINLKKKLANNHIFKYNTSIHMYCKPGKKNNLTTKSCVNIFLILGKIQAKFYAVLVKSCVILQICTF